MKSASRETQLADFSPERCRYLRPFPPPRLLPPPDGRTDPELLPELDLAALGAEDVDGRDDCTFPPPPPPPPFDLPDRCGAEKTGVLLLGAARYSAPPPPLDLRSVDRGGAV